MTTPKPSAKSATFSLNVSAKELFVVLWIVFAYYTVRSLGPLLQEALLPGSGPAVLFVIECLVVGGVALSPLYLGYAFLRLLAPFAVEDN